MKNKTYKYKNKNEEKVDYFVFIALAFIIGVIPLIVKYAIVPVSPDENMFVRLKSTTEDIFAYYKSGLLIASAVVLSFYYLYRFFTSDFHFDLKGWFKNPLFISCMAYIAAILLSSLFSPFHYTVLHGASDRYENVFVLLSYLIIFYAVQDFVRTPVQAKLILSVLLASAFVLGLISLSQFVNRDVFPTNFGREYAGFPQGILSRFVLGSANYNYLKEMVVNLEPVFDTVYATLYNPNCVGLYGALIAPLFIVTGIFWSDVPKKDPVENQTSAKQKKTSHSPLRFILLLIGVFVCFMIFGARSSGGLLGISVAAFITLAMSILYFVRQKDGISRFSLIAAVGTLCLIAALTFVPLIHSNLKTMVYKFYEYTNPVNSYFLRDIRIQGQTLTIDTNKGPLVLDFQSGLDNPDLSDGSGLPLALAQKEISEEDFCHVYSSGLLGDVTLIKASTDMAVLFSGENLFFTMTEENEIKLLSHLYKPVDIYENIPAVGFEGRELFGSGRGYIWSRSLPLILNRPLFGTGPDTFILSFPQHDLLGKVRYLGNPYITVDKPHNYYLQVALNTGLISLVALLFIFGLYVIPTFLSLFKSPNQPHQDFGFRLGIFAGICGYLVSSFATDSTVSVSPVFWGVLGLGFGVEQYVKKRKAADI